MAGIHHVQEQKSVEHLGKPDAGGGPSLKQSKPKPSKKRKVRPFPALKPLPSRQLAGSLPRPRCSPMLSDAPRCSSMLIDAHRCSPMLTDAPRPAPAAQGKADSSDEDDSDADDDEYMDDE